MVPLNRDECLAVLQAWLTVRNSGWSTLAALPATVASTWSGKNAEQLALEVRRLRDQTNEPSCQVRVFWKRAPEYSYLGCNTRFAQDAGIANADAMDGLDDFSPRVAWRQQAGKYRADDERVVASGKPLLDILERQTQPTGVVYVRTGKAPLRVGASSCFGILGMYEVLDEATARRLFHAHMRSGGY